MRLGLVASLSRPAGNVTGVTQLNVEVAPKRVELVRELIPAARTIALLVNPSNPLAGTPTSFAPRTQAFVEGLRDLGYVEGRSVAFEWKWGQDRVDRLPDMAAELVGSQVDVIVTGGTPATKAVKKATRTIPIVMAMVGDPVGAGLVESLGRPGGNATGLSIVATDLSGKRLQLLKEIVPRLSSIAVMSYGPNPQSQMELREAQIAAQRLDIRVYSVPLLIE